MLVAVLDACVLYPATLRNLFMWLAAGMVYQPRWTEKIHVEWMRNVLANNPGITNQQLERTRQLMEQINDESLVVDYEKHIATLHLPDPNDRHVLAAAIEAEASVIVTFNLSDFPSDELDAYAIKAMHPDDYLCALMDEDPDLFLLSVRDHRMSLTKPHQTPTEYIESLRALGLRNLTHRIEQLDSSI